VTKPLVDTIVSAFPAKFWDDLSPRFFITFWTLSMYDLEVPKISYDREVDRLKNQIQQTEENKDLVASKKKKEVERCRLLQERLLEEQLRQDEHVRRVRQRLEKERDQWFQSSMYSKSDQDGQKEKSTDQTCFSFRASQNGDDHSVSSTLFIS
jgi:chromosome 7 SCAF14703, whole genome shotgun sequence. (fragment)